MVSGHGQAVTRAHIGDARLPSIIRTVPSAPPGRADQLGLSDLLTPGEPGRSWALPARTRGTPPVGNLTLPRRPTASIARERLRPRGSTLGCGGPHLLSDLEHRVLTPLVGARSAYGRVPSLRRSRQSDQPLAGSRSGLRTRRQEQVKVASGEVVDVHRGSGQRCEKALDPSTGAAFRGASGSGDADIVDTAGTIERAPVLPALGILSVPRLIGIAGGVRPRIALDQVLIRRTRSQSMWASLAPTMA